LYYLILGKVTTANSSKT